MNLNKLQETWTFQADFSIGEITPLLQARVDIDQYYKALKTAKNVVNLPQGPMTKRFGLRYISQIIGISTFTEIRLASFEYSSDTQYVLVFIPGSIIIYQNDELVATVPTIYTSDQIIELRFDQNLNQLIIVHPDVPPYQLIRGSDSFTWSFSLFSFKNVPTFDFTNNYNTITFTLGAEMGQDVILTASAAVFTPDYVGGSFTSIPGLAKIISYSSPAVVHVNIYIAFGSLQVNGYEAILAEPAFSDTRGWPQSIAFYQSRLFFGGTKSLPQGLFGSVLNQYDNFLTGLGLPTDALILFLAGARLNSIQYLLNAVSLFVFTSGGQYATQPLTTQALTPSTASISKQTSTGIQINVTPFFIDNDVLYVQKGGRDVIKMSYNIAYSSYETTSLAFTAEHLIKNPVDNSKLEHSQNNQGTYAYYCNGDPLAFDRDGNITIDSGTLAILQIIQEEKIQSWTWAETPNGKFRRTVGLDTSVYFVIERIINGETVFYLERQDDEASLDCTSNFTPNTPTNIIYGLDYLEGEKVAVITQSGYAGEFTVLAGKVELPQLINTAEIGLLWIPVIETLPINIQTQQGNNIYQKKQIRQTYLHVYKSEGITINDILIPEINIGIQDLNKPIEYLDGVYQIPTSYGWEWNQPLIISQVVPAPFTILGISYQTEF